MYAWMSHVSHMNEARLTHEWVMSRAWMSHVSHMNESRYRLLYSESSARCLFSMSYALGNESCHTYEWVMSHVWVSHITHNWVTSRTNEPCHTSITSHVTHLSHTNEPCHTERRLGDVCMNESCLTHEWVMSHTWMSHVSHMNESCLTHEWVMSRIFETQSQLHDISFQIRAMSHVTYDRVTSQSWMSHVTQRVGWTIYAGGFGSGGWVTSRITESCHKHEWVMSHTE